MPTKPKTNNPEETADDLDLSLDRETILLAGDPSSGKSMSAAFLCLDGLEKNFKVHVIDRDRGLAKAIKELFILGRVESAIPRLKKLNAFGKRPANLTYTLADNWDKMPIAVNNAIDTLRAGDWLVFDMVGRMWDFAQDTFSERVYGGATEHLLLLRADAQAEVDRIGGDLRSNDPEKRKKAQAEVSKKMQYEGLEGRTDWTVIKRMHNNDVFDKAITRGQFNMLSTTSLSPISKEDIEKKKYPDWEGIMKHPEGEKHQVYRHDTLAVAYRKNGDGGTSYRWRTDMGMGKGKDRGGRPLLNDMDCTGEGFVASYLAAMADA